MLWFIRFIILGDYMARLTVSVPICFKLFQSMSHDPIRNIDFGWDVSPSYLSVFLSMLLWVENTLTFVYLSLLSLFHRLLEYDGAQPWPRGWFLATGSQQYWQLPSRPCWNPVSSLDYWAASLFQHFLAFRTVRSKTAASLALLHEPAGCSWGPRTLRAPPHSFSQGTSRQCGPAYKQRCKSSRYQGEILRLCF